MMRSDPADVRQKRVGRMQRFSRCGMTVAAFCGRERIGLCLLSIDQASTRLLKLGSFLVRIDESSEGAILGILMYYGFAFAAGVVLGLLLAIGGEPLLQYLHRKSLKTRRVAWGCLIAGSGMMAATCQFIYARLSMGPEAMPGIGNAIFWTFLFPASLFCAAILGAIILWPRIHPRVVSVTIIVSSAIAWGVSDVWSWIPLEQLLRITLGITLFGENGLVKPDTWFGMHTVIAAGLLGLAALIVLMPSQRKVRDFTPNLR